MTLEDQITALLAQAEPLRCLADDEPAKVPLTAIVDEINRLRAIQANAPVAVVDQPAPDPERPAEDGVPVLPTRRPGRPRKPAEAI